MIQFALSTSLLMLWAGPSLGQGKSPDRLVTVPAAEYQYDGLVRILETNGVNVVIGPEVIKDPARTVYINIHDKPLRDALDAIAAGYSAHWQAFGEIYVLEPGLGVYSTGSGGIEREGARGIYMTPSPAQAIGRVSFTAPSTNVPVKVFDVAPVKTVTVRPGEASTSTFSPPAVVSATPARTSVQLDRVGSAVRAVRRDNGEVVLSYSTDLMRPARAVVLSQARVVGTDKARLLNSISDAQWNHIWSQGYVRLRDLTKAQRQQVLELAHGKLTHSMVLTDHGRRLVVRP